MVRNLLCLILTPLILAHPFFLSGQPCNQFRTQTQGGWGSSAAGNNPGAYRDAHFQDAFPQGLVVGCNFTLSLSDAAAVQTFLPSGGTARSLDQNLVDPSDYGNVLAGQLVALTLSLAFDAANPDFAPSQTLLADQVVNQGIFAGYSVQEVVAEANAVFGGCDSPFSASQMADVLAYINQNYVDGVQNNGYLDCPELSPPCEIKVEGISTECLDADTYSLSLTISGAYGYFELVAPTAVSGSGQTACFDLAQTQAFSLIFPAGVDYTFQFVGGSSDDCEFNGSTCEVPSVTGPAPSCCSLSITCNAPAQTQFTCITAIPPADTSTVQVNSGCGNVSITVSETTSGNGCSSSPYRLFRTYAVSDGVNSQSCTQTFTVIDNIAPQITCPGPQYLSCTTNREPDVNATAVDNCSNSVFISYYNGPVANCASFVRTWIAVDNCGNSAYCYQTVYIEDDVPPILSVPGPRTVNCSQGTLPQFTGQAIATDACSSVNLSYVDGIPNGTSCNRVFLRTWTATDACGNLSTGTQEITVIDNVGPVITGLPGNITMQCGEIPPPPNAVGIDQCAGDTLPVTMTESVFISGCRKTITRIYTSVDHCGNTGTASRNIVIQDTQGPQMTCPSDVLLSCGDTLLDPSVLGYAEAVDNCSGTFVTISYEDSERISNACPPLINRIWTAVDTCGNVSNCTQRIMFEDNEPPVLTCLDDMTVDCALSGIDPSEIGYPEVSDFCSEVSLSYTDGALTGSCPVSFVRVWTASDACGNPTSCTQVITLIDEVAPVISCPADITISCAYSTAPPSRTGWATAEDVCTEVAISYIDGPIDGACTKSFTRTWSATDFCGNTATCTQIISLADAMLPLVFCPADTVVSCGADISPELMGHATAVDFCSEVTVAYADENIPGSCPPAIARLWTATDECGNSRSCTQTISIGDMASPEILCPNDISLVCGSDASPEFTGTAQSIGGCAEVEIYYADSAYVGPGTTGTSDSCGLLRTQTQGSWGSEANGNNPGTYRDANFEGAFPHGLVLGCNYTFTLTSPAAVARFLPSGGPAIILSQNLIDPTEFSSVLAGQLVAASLSVGFDNYDPYFGTSEVALGDMIISSGAFESFTVNEVLEEANMYFGGCSSNYSASDLISALTAINESFVDGTGTSQFLVCPEQAGTGNSCGGIFRTWYALDACGNVDSCVQNISFSSASIPAAGEIAGTTIHAFPSPSSGIINLNVLGGFNAGDKIELVNLTGLVLQTLFVSNNSPSYALNLSNLQSGLYIIQWTGLRGSGSVKVIKE